MNTLQTYLYISAALSVFVIFVRHIAMCLTKEITIAKTIKGIPAGVVIGFVIIWYTVFAACLYVLYTLVTKTIKLIADIGHAFNLVIAKHFHNFIIWTNT